MKNNDNCPDGVSWHQGQIHCIYAGGIAYGFHSDATYMVGTYSPGKELVVYEMSMHVFPTAPSPTTTHFISLSVLAILREGGREGGKEGRREGGRE